VQERAGGREKDMDFGWRMRGALGVNAGGQRKATLWDKVTGR